ncbi:MAG: hypothetical protein AB7F43_10260 [Bacteriovoracia bacterium]
MGIKNRSVLAKLVIRIGTLSLFVFGASASADRDQVSNKTMKEQMETWGNIDAPGATVRAFNGSHRIDRDESFNVKITKPASLAGKEKQENQIVVGDEVSFEVKGGRSKSRIEFDFINGAGVVNELDRSTRLGTYKMGSYYAGECSLLDPPVAKKPSSTSAAAPAPTGHLANYTPALEECKANPSIDPRCPYMIASDKKRTENDVPSWCGDKYDSLVSSVNITPNSPEKIGIQTGTSGWGSSGWGRSTSSFGGGFGSHNNKKTEYLPNPYKTQAVIRFSDGNKDFDLKFKVRPTLIAYTDQMFWNSRSAFQPGQPSYHYTYPNNTTKIFIEGGVGPYTITKITSDGGSLESVDIPVSQTYSSLSPEKQIGVYTAANYYGDLAKIQVKDSWDPPHVSEIDIMVLNPNPVIVEIPSKVSIGGSVSFTVRGGDGGYNCALKSGTPGFVSYGSGSSSGTYTAPGNIDTSSSNTNRYGIVQCVDVKGVTAEASTKVVKMVNHWEPYGTMKSGCITCMNVNKHHGWYYCDIAQTENHMVYAHDCPGFFYPVALYTTASCPHWNDSVTGIDGTCQILPGLPAWWQNNATPTVAYRPNGSSYQSVIIECRGNWAKYVGGPDIIAGGRIQCGHEE